MENQNTKDKMFKKFTWTLTNFSTLDSKKLYSDTFSIDGHTWRIIIFPKGNRGNSMSIYLDAGVATMPHGWEKLANFKLILINQLNHERNIIRETSHTFNSEQGVWGYTSYISLGALWNSSLGFIVNDTCIIEAHIFVNMLDHENKLVESIENLFPMEMISTSSFDEVVDFIPLLEDVCSRYPSLIDKKKKKSQRFIKWSFTALGRVLHFLNTKKVRDMDDDACNHLQTLWEELETCGFELSWLKPHVQSALGMKTCVEKVLAAKRLEENVTTLEKNVAILEMEEKTLRTKRIEAEVNLEITRRDLVKAKEDFVECDLDAELWKTMNCI
ncbi:MATH domain and coiled-coil domain-containing protein At3g58250-like [Vigna radiata var. radiata]|uniref:MATH domain and coiled-coil domain-containing protein At3g58250-like n=1 Tax=Vigna radiata var. radiata TaxID=3916 RepID=A0A1S3UZ43_VIGRR|nr:MATH domain and coiled-coil domain-containing protein At3g58250-like [Vigna radiata var. radiata]